MVRVVPLLILAAGCNPSLRIQVLQPSLVTSPPEIQQLTVVDRSRAKNVGQGILGALEGAITGEAIGADTNGRSRAMTAVVTGLRASPRFDAAETWAARKDLESSLFDKELSWAGAQRICEDSGCQGIVALEAFDSDSSTDVDKRIVERVVDGKKVKETVYDAQRVTRVTTAWRYYDVVHQQVLDDLRTFDSSYTWTESGPTERDARSKLPDQGASVAYVGTIAGTDYAMRIAPTYVWVSRSYYGGGHDQLKLAKNHVKALDWPGAARIWTELHATSPDPKIKGRAAFDLALAAEVQGDLQTAASWATEAATLLGNGKARSYRMAIEGRIADQARVEHQMRTTPVDEAPLAIPPR
ncbi:MAG: tetratricopeptide repeat protein [Alphaproteobacteria bacterium]|nr:tetratricopeptide repeat protein [Alphaproteobacteria bacterium]